MDSQVSPEQLALQFCQQAEQLVNQKQWKVGITLCQQALKQDPHCAKADKTLGVIYQAEGQIGVAEQSNLTTEIDYIAIGDLFTQQQQLQVALDCYQQAIELNPQFFKSYHKLASVLVQLEQWQDAITAYQVALQLNPNFCWSYNGLGRVLIQLERWQEAITAYQAAIQLNPDFCWSYYHLGKAYFNLEQWENAVECFEKAIQINPEFPQFYREQGMTYMKMQAWEKAVITFQKLIEFDSAYPKIYLTLAEAFIKLECWQDVVLIYRKLIDLNFQSQLSDSHFIQLGKACSQAGEFTDAIACYQQAITLQPNQPWLYSLLAEALQKTQQPEPAIKAYHQAIKLGLSSPWLLTNLGDLYTQMNQFKAATTAYQQACYQSVVADYPEFAAKNITLKPCDFPDFLIIGSSKCGTTSLYHNIIDHSQVLPALKKEIKFWHDDLKQGLDWYRAHFPPHPKNKSYVTGEASPNYLDLPDTAQRVFQFCPNIKLIIILRNPVERAISHYYHWVRLNLEDRSLAEVIQTEFKTIEQVLQFPIQYQRWYQSINYIARGVYIGFIQQWMQIFPPEQFLILSCESLASQPEATMKQVFSFLGLPDSPLPRYTQLNVGHYPSISPSLSQTLSQFYQPYNQQLEEYLGVKFGWN